MEYKMELSTNAQSKSSMKISIYTLHSSKHLRCADVCARNCRVIENNIKDGVTDENKEFYYDDQALATGAVITSVAFLEATINEFFSDCENNSENIKPIGENKIELLKQQWKKDIKCKRNDRYSLIFCKYITAYSIIKGKGFEKDSELSRNLVDLIKLRNALVHFKPKWQATEPIPDDPYKLNHLKGKFAENIFTKESGDAFFPKKCLGAGCAEWAINTSKNFVEKFFTDISLQINNFEFLRRNTLEVSLQYVIKHD